MLAVLLSGSAWADPEDTLNLLVSTSMTQDDNLFRASDSALLGPTQSRSEMIQTTGLGFKIDKRYSLQRFLFESTATDYSFKNNRYLDYVGKNVNANWQWSLTPRLHGNLSSTYNESQASFTDYGGGIGKNVRTVETERFDAEWEAMGPWRLTAGVSRNDTKNAQTIAVDNSSTTESMDWGLRYVAASGSFLALVLRNSDGRYSSPVNLVSKQNSPFHLNETELRYTWLPTGKSRLSGRIAQVDRKYQDYSERDYQGVVGNIDWTYGVTGQWTLVLGWQRALSPYTSTDASYYISEGYNVMPVWQITAKTSMRLRYAHETRSYRGALTTPLRAEERMNQSMLAFDWAALRTLTLSASYQRQTRNTARTGGDFASNMSMITANLAF